jgi:cytoskeletal protein CcmA (bactofilin family)
MTVNARDESTQAGACMLGEDATFTGQIEGRDVTILGRFKGKLQLLGRLKIGRNARVEAEVRAVTVEINGEFVGDIKARSLVFGETARARGTFISERLGMREGASVSGSFPPPESSDKEGAAPTLVARSTPSGNAPQKEALVSHTAAPVVPASSPPILPGEKATPMTSASREPTSPSMASETSAPSTEAAVATPPTPESNSPTPEKSGSTEENRVARNDKEKKPEASPAPQKRPDASDSVNESPVGRG